MPKVIIPKKDKFGFKVGFALFFLFLLILIGAIFMSKDEVKWGDAFFSASTIVTHAPDSASSGNFKYVYLILGVLGGVTQFYIIYVLLEYVLEGKLTDMFTEVKMLKHIKSLKDHYIICGGGRVGLHVAEQLRKYNKEVVILEQDPKLVEKIKLLGLPVIESDALQEHELIKAGIKEAKYLVASLGDDGGNILLVLTAKELNPLIKIAARANHENIANKLRHAGANHVVLPEVLGGLQIAHTLLKEG